jgi:hypothetical protein
MAELIAAEFMDKMVENYKENSEFILNTQKVTIDED